MLSDVGVALHAVVALSLRDEHFFEFVLVDLLRRDPDLHQHLNRLPQLSNLYNTAITLLLDFRNQLLNKLLFDLGVKNYVVLELTHLQMLHTWLLHFWNIVSVHVHEDVLDHNNVQLLLLPNLIDSLKQVVFTTAEEFFDHGLE